MAAEIALGDAVPAPAVARGWTAWRRPALLALAVVAALHLVLGAWAAWTLAREPAIGLDQLYAHVAYPLQHGGLVAPWEQADAVWYEKIAAHGYHADDGTGGFFPLLPLFMWLVSPLTGGNMAGAGLLAGSLAAVAALALLYRLALLDAGAPAAARAVAYLALFPTAFFLISAFTEPLFLALVLGAFWAIRGGRWPLAVLLGILAGLTKVQGALVGLPLAVEYLIVCGWPRRGARPSWLALGSILASGALGTLAFFAYLAYGVRDSLSYTERQLLQFHHHIAWPGETLVTAVGHALSPAGYTIDRFDLLVLLLFSALALAAFRLRLSYGLYAGLILGFSWLHVNEAFPLMSVSRFVLVAFPCFLVLAIWALRRPRFVHLAIITLWVSWLLFWSMAFVHGHWVA